MSPYPIGDNTLRALMAPGQIAALERQLVPLSTGKVLKRRADGARSAALASRKLGAGGVSICWYERLGKGDEDSWEIRLSGPRTV